MMMASPELASDCGSCLSVSQSEIEFTHSSVPSTLDTSSHERLELLSELFHERCSLLYHDILDWAHDATTTDSDAASSVDSPRSGVAASIGSRYARLLEQADTLRQLAPHLQQDVTYRLQLLTAVYKQHVLNGHQSDAYTSADEAGGQSRSAGLSELSGWLHLIDGRLRDIESHHIDSAPIQLIHKLALKQKDVQRCIERDGRRLVSGSAPPDHEQQQQQQQQAAARLHRWRSQHQALTNRWHRHWLRSLELAFRLEEQQQLHSLGLRVLPHPTQQNREPAPKRRRLSSESDSRIASPPLLPDTCSDETVLEEKLMQLEQQEMALIEDHQQQQLIVPNIEFRDEQGHVLVDGLPTPVDVGYSSGENSLHESVSPGLVGLKEPHSHINASPVKIYYKMTPLDDAGVTDTETPRLQQPEETLVCVDGACGLTESMCVNVGADDSRADSTQEHRELLEVLSLLDTDQLPANDTMEKSAFGAELERLLAECQPGSGPGTTWAEFTSGSSHGHGRMVMSKSCIENIRNSCDASSEESESEFGGGAVDLRSCLDAYSLGGSTADRQHTCSNSWLRQQHAHSTPQQQRRQQQQQHSLTLSGSERKRRKLRARRLPRSMSDGEHLGHIAYNMQQQQQRTSTTKVGSSPVPGLCSPQSATGSDIPPDPECSAHEASASEQEGVWHWDDYKPPAHIDQDGAASEGALDDSELTAFGDDYLPHIQPISEEHSDNDYSSSTHKRRLSGARLDLDELVARSHQQLCQARSLLEQCAHAPDASKDALCVVQLSEANIASLQQVSHRLLAGNQQCSHQQYQSLTGLLKCWQDVLFTSRLPSASGSALQRLSDSVDTTALLQSQIRRFGANLKALIEEAALPDIEQQHYSSLDEINGALKLFQDVAIGLRQERQGLRLLSQSSNALPGDIAAELNTLCRCCDQALHSCEQHIDTLHSLRQHSIEYQETVANVQQLLLHLTDGLDRLEAHDALNDYDKIVQLHSSLGQCQERLSRLDRVAEYLQSLSDYEACSTNGDVDSAVWSCGSGTAGEASTGSQAELTAINAQLSAFKTQMHQLQSRLDAVGQRPLSPSKARSSQQQTGTTQTDTLQLTHRKSQTTHHNAMLANSQPTTVNIKPQQKCSSSSTGLWSWLRSGWPWAALLCALCLWLLPPLLHGNGNSYRNTFGPQLDYVRGPPPS